jgi:hypothetical protein
MKPPIGALAPGTTSIPKPGLDSLGQWNKMRTEVQSPEDEPMPNAGRSARARDFVAPELPRIDLIARAYLESANGNALLALERAIGNALADLAEMERRVLRAEALVSHGFVRGRLGTSD